MTLPFIDALHRWRPELKVDVLVEDRFSPVFLRHPAVHEVLRLRSRDARSPGGWSKGRTLFEILKRRYSAVMNLHGGNTSLIFTLFSGAMMRIGQESHRRSWAYSCRIPDSSSIWMREKLHTVEHQLSLLKWLGLPMPEAPAASLFPDEEARERVRERLRKSNLSPGNYLLIQPTATLFTKQWPAAKFAELADWLSQHLSLPVVFTSGPAEEQALLDIGRNVSGSYCYWSDLRLDDLFALIEGCRLFVGNDSGPMHAAAALRKPLVVVWGSSNYAAWHPWGTRFEAVVSNLPCMPCPGYTCEAFGEPKCIQDLPVERVKQACEKILAEAAPAAPSVTG